MFNNVCQLWCEEEIVDTSHLNQQGLDHLKIMLCGDYLIINDVSYIIEKRVHQVECGITDVYLRKESI